MVELSPWQRFLKDEALASADLFPLSDPALDDLRKGWINYAFEAAPFKEKEEVLIAFLKTGLELDDDTVSGVKKGDRLAGTAVARRTLDLGFTNGSLDRFWDEVDAISPNLHSPQQRQSLSSNPACVIDFISHLTKLNVMSSLASTIGMAVTSERINRVRGNIDKASLSGLLT